MEATREAIVDSLDTVPEAERETSMRLFAFSSMLV